MNIADGILKPIKPIIGLRIKLFKTVRGIAASHGMWVSTKVFYEGNP